MNFLYTLQIVDFNGNHKTVGSGLTHSKLITMMNGYEGKCSRMFYHRD